MSPSTVHEPASTSNFFNSGPGLGGSVWDNPAAAPISHAANMSPARFITALPQRLDVPAADLKAPRRSHAWKALPVSPMRRCRLLKLQLPCVSLLHPHRPEMLLARPA